ncbi:Fur family transcriptional regulator [Virgibacillus sp. 179-BFC.A HS]|uniref:Fur family transcriptional regulator n=1 Tax=Tigheibacillus jepli TaxID=3035914 RepID=A0ABU5CFV9_9BACI|nr:Fur family transcriptional regulator [Virgibacillus sp. 179-BFC.A HS]MDY0405202.1 Fur family transcriptional regulator [Virgibacillus sp. 179-BFC.A HS]
MNIEEAIETLKDKGYKTTGRRKDILSFFAEADGYRTARDLIQYMEQRHDGISFDTIYRNLHLFVEMGILETTELDGEKHFQIACAQHHHHHFICKCCGKTKEVDICPMKNVDSMLPGCIIENHKFEIYGICPQCKTS